MSFPPHISRLWWLKNIRYFIYFVREFSGVVIAGYMFYLMYLMIRLKFGLYKEGEIPMVNPFHYFGSFVPISFVAFIFALFHALTWLYVMAKITPVKIGRFLVPQKIMFGALLILWLGISYGLLISVYV